MKYTLLVLILSAHQVFPQTVFEVREFKKGIYANATEFLENSPSISLEGIEVSSAWKYLAENLVVVEERFNETLKRKIDVYKGDNFKMSSKELINKENGKKIKNKNYWGFSDGTGIYINSKSHSSAWDYVGLSFIGRYSFFRQTGSPIFLINDPHHDYFTVDEYVIDSNTGETIRLTKKRVLKRVLVDDPDISAQLKDGRCGKSTFQDCISAYNLTHWKDIKVLQGD